MAPRWAESTAKHGISRSDAVHAVLNATYTDVIDDGEQDQGQIRLFIGPRHSQALPGDEVEILVHEYPDHPGREAEIFHVMPLGPKFRRYRDENPR